MEKESLIALYNSYKMIAPYIAPFGALSIFMVIALNNHKEGKPQKLMWTLAALAFVPTLLHLLVLAEYWKATEAAITGAVIIPLPQAANFYFELFVGALTAGFLWLRFVSAKFNKVAASFTLASELERNQKTDVRTIHKILPDPEKLPDFNPEQYFDISKGIFTGVGLNGEPVFIPCQSYKQNQATGIDFHGSIPFVQVTGSTGYGKGQMLGVMSAQFVERGEAVCFIDPKNDEYAPSCLFHSAKRTNKPYYFCNLNKPNPPQLNLFQGCTEEEGFELFLAGFGLSDTGDVSDFYGIADRYQAILTARLIAEKRFNLAQAYEARKEELHHPENGAEKFAGRLREMSWVSSINALDGEGISLEKLINEGGALYAVGSMRNDIIKTLQRMLLVRVLQLAERRERIDTPLRPVAIVLDEVKYHLSRPALEALGAARDKGVHVLLTHQSLGDLKDCPKDINPDSVVDAIVENCSIKIFYRVINPMTAEWLEKMSGKIQADGETRKVTRNLAGAEIVDPVRSITQTETYYIDSNQLMRMPKGVAVLFSGGLPQLISVKPMRVKKSREAIRIQAVPGTLLQSAEKAIAVDDDLI